MTDQKTAIVTGASSGIGRATAIRLAEADFRTVLLARSEDKLKELAADIGPSAWPLPCDVADPAAIDQAVGQVAEQWGRIDALANIAGKALLKPIAQTEVEEWRQMVDVNLTSVYAATRAVWPVFTQQKSGMIVNVSSMAAKDPFPGFGVYATVKAAVNMFTHMTAQEGKKIGVGAVCIGPGAVETPMLRGMFTEKQVPADKALEPDQVAQLIRDCITGDRAFTPGETIYVNG